MREAESQLSIAWATITELKKELSKKDKEKEVIKQTTYDQGQKETETHLKSQLLVVCRSFCLQTWIKALNTTKVDSNSTLRNPDRAFYPLAIRACPAIQSSVSTFASAPPSSTENPQSKSSTTTPTQVKPKEQQPKTTTSSKAKPTE